jgi:hypothetical protein
MWDQTDFVVLVVAGGAIVMAIMAIWQSRPEKIVAAVQRITESPETMARLENSYNQLTPREQALINTVTTAMTFLYNSVPSNSTYHKPFQESLELLQEITDKLPAVEKPMPVSDPVVEPAGSDK